MTPGQPFTATAQGPCLSHRPLPTQPLARASTLLAMALFLFVLPLAYGGGDVNLSITGGFLASALAAAALGTLVVSAVRGYRATDHLALLLSSTLAPVFALTLPALLVFISRSAWDRVLFLVLVPGGIFLGAHVALLSSRLATKEEGLWRVALSGLALVGSAGPLLGLLWFDTGRYNLWVVGLALTVIAAGSNVALAAKAGQPPKSP